MLYPSFFSGAVYNDNLYSTQTNRIAGVGIRLRPALTGSVDNGLHTTSISFLADAQIYPGTGQYTTFTPSPTTYVAPTNVTGGASISHIWKPTADLTVQVLGAYSRLNGLYLGGMGNSVATVPAPSGFTVSNTQQYSNQFAGMVSVQKTMGQWFVGANAGAQYITYDSQPTNYGFGFVRATNPSQNGVSYTAGVRGGYWLTPLLYAYVQPSAVFNNYQASRSNSNGYRVVGGIGTSMISLFRGEVYAGYQAQYAINAPQSIASPTFGGNLSYFPTQYLTLTANINQSIGFGTPNYLYGVPVGAGPGNRTWQATGTATYALSQYWNAYVRGGYGETRWSGRGLSWGAWSGDGMNANWIAGAGVNYNFWRNISLTLDYVFTKATGYGGVGNLTALPFFNAWPGDGYSRNMVSAGLTYRY